MKRVLVIGAGATGKAAALALAPMAERVTLFDGRAKPGMAGGALMMWSNAISALDCLGIDVAKLARRASVALQRMDFRTWEGDLLWPMAINQLSSCAGAPSLLVDREVLQEVLQKRVDARATIDRDQRTFWNFRLAGSTVDAVFTDGGVERGDLLLGAEGATSRVRSRLLGPPRYRKTGQWVAFGYSTVPSEIAPVGACYCLMDANHRFFAAGLPENWPHRARSYWGASVPASLLDESDSRRDPHHRPFTLAKLRDAFRGAAPEVEALLAGSGDDGVATPRWWATESRDVRPGGSWHRDRVALLGDAAHLMTYDLGQGQAMGLEDAVVLGRCVAKHRDDVLAALGAFESARHYRVGVITELSYRAAQVSTPGVDVLSWLRDFATANVYAPINERTMRYMLEVDLGERSSGAGHRGRQVGDDRAPGSRP